MKPQLTHKEWEHRGRRFCNRCKEHLPDHDPACPTLKEKTPKPWRKHSNRGNRIPEPDEE
jgi:hypothetical protein